MLTTIFTSITISFAFVLSWLQSLFDSIGGVKSIIIAAFMMYTSTRLLLRPLIGYAASDLVSKSKTKKSNNKSR